MKALAHQVVNVSLWMIFLFAEDTIAELLVQGPRLEAEGAEKCSGASACNRLRFSRRNQLPALSSAAKQPVNQHVFQLEPGTHQVAERSTDDFAPRVAGEKIVRPQSLLRQTHCRVGM